MLSSTAFIIFSFIDAKTVTNVLCICQNNTANIVKEMRSVCKEFDEKEELIGLAY